jgi:aryl-alcohol dehydrogenase-like predicted oxidoreductase
MGYPKAIEMLRYAYDRGIRLFDCADMYGTHDVVTQALKGKPRDSYVLVTKLWLRGGGLPEQERLDPGVTVRRFLRECSTDYIDVVQIHCVDTGAWTQGDPNATGDGRERWAQQRYADAMGSLAKLKQEGLIRAHGISSHSIAASELAAKETWCDVVHVRINSEGLSLDTPQNNPQAVENAVRVCKENHDAGKGIIAMKVLGEGRMASDPEMRKRSTKFVMDLGTVNTMIIGFTEMEQITEFVTNVAALTPAS